MILRGGVTEPTNHRAHRPRRRTVASRVRALALPPGRRGPRSRTRHGSPRRTHHGPSLQLLRSTGNITGCAIGAISRPPERVSSVAANTRASTASTTPSLRLAPYQLHAHTNSNANHHHPGQACPRNDIGKASRGIPAGTTCSSCPARRKRRVTVAARPAASRKLQAVGGCLMPTL